MEKGKDFIGTVTSKGQITIPVEVRRHLGLKPQDKVVFRVSDGKAELTPLPMSLEEAYGSVEPLQSPEDFAAIRKIVGEERAAKVIATLKP